MEIGSATIATATPDKNNKSISLPLNIIGLKYFLVMENPGITVSSKAIIPNVPNVVMLKYFNTNKVVINIPLISIYLQAKFIKSKNNFISSPKYSCLNRMRYFMARVTKTESTNHNRVMELVHSDK